MTARMSLFWVVRTTPAPAPEPPSGVCAPIPGLPMLGMNELLPFPLRPGVLKLPPRLTRWFQPSASTTTSCAPPRATSAGRWLIFAPAPTVAYAELSTTVQVAEPAMLSFCPSVVAVVHVSTVPFRPRSPVR